MQKEKKAYKKYDDEAFQNDLKSFKFGDELYHRDEVDVKKIIQTALQVEDESHKLKAKHTGAKHVSLYSDSQQTVSKEPKPSSFIERNKK